MGIRRLLRARARANMARLGMVQLNKERIGPDGTPIGSRFAREWRRYTELPPEITKAMVAYRRKHGLPVAE